MLLTVTFSPSARYGHAMASLENSDTVLLFGGNNGNDLDDTWTFDLSNNKWKKVDTKSPSPRFFHAMASLRDNDKVLLFGGLDDTHNFDDTWLFNQSTSTWTTNTNSPTSPSAREGHSMATLGIDGNVLLFGGRANGASDSDTWMYDRKISQWTKFILLSSNIILTF